MNFKLLAIRPLGSCDQRFLKNLEPGKLYKFYNDYKFLDDKGKEIVNDDVIIQIKNEDTVPTELYKRKSGLDINISALVGKNGSGKSTY